MQASNDTLATLLKSAMEQRGLKATMIAHSLDVADSTVSGFHRAKTLPDLDQLPAIAKEYQLEHIVVFQAWCQSQTRSNQVRDLLAGLFGGTSSLPDHGAPTRPPALRAHADAFRIAGQMLADVEKCKRDLDGRMQDLIKTLTEVGHAKPIEHLCVPNVRLDKVAWEPLGKSVYVSKQTVFVANRPSPLAVELHKFAPHTGALHRLEEFENQSDTLELWTVVRGEGRLLLQEGSDAPWREVAVAIGSCGYYWGRERHIWLNTSTDAELVLYHVFYPYRGAALAQSGPGEAFEFDLDHLPSSLPGDVARELKRVNSSRT